MFFDLLRKVIEDHLDEIIILEKQFKRNLYGVPTMVSGLHSRHRELPLLVF